MLEKNLISAVDFHQIVDTKDENDVVLKREQKLQGGFLKVQNDSFYDSTRGTGFRCFSKHLKN